MKTEFRSDAHQPKTFFFFFHTWNLKRADEHQVVKRLKCSERRLGVMLLRGGGVSGTGGGGHWSS